MARKAIVDKEVILAMLKEGETTQHIADKFSVSRQAIDLHRKDFIVKGLLDDKRAARRKRSETQSDAVPPQTANRFPELVKEETNSPEIPISLDNQIDLIINAFHALKRINLMEKELNAYKQENERVKREIENLKERERKRIEQESRWMLIQNNEKTESKF